MSKCDLQHFETRLKALVGENTNLRPFVCEGSPLDCQAFIVDFNPATELTEPFWKFWNSDYGFNKLEWFEHYKQERQHKPLALGKTKRAVVSNTQRAIDWITESAMPVQRLETNLYALATAQAKDLLAPHRNPQSFNSLLNEFVPRCCSRMVRMQHNI